MALLTARPVDALHGPMAGRQSANGKRKAIELPRGVSQAFPSTLCHLSTTRENARAAKAPVPSSQPSVRQRTFPEARPEG